MLQAAVVHFYLYLSALQTASFNHCVCALHYCVCAPHVSHVHTGSAPGGEDEALPKKGLFALPFMARALERKRQLAMMEATATLNQLEGEATANGTANGEYQRSPAALARVHLLRPGQRCVHYKRP